MKVIGRGENKSYIVEMKEDELAKLHGRSSFYHQKDPRVGDQFPVSDMYKRAYKTLHLYQEVSDNFDKLHEHIGTFKDLLAKQNAPVLKEASDGN